METNYKPKQTTHEEEEEEAAFTPVCPLSQSLNSSLLSLYILAVFELENPINESEMLEFIQTKFISISPCFTSIIENDKNGVPRWKKVEIQYEDHVIVPTFPLGLMSREEYDEQLRVYLSEIGCKNLSESKPLWEAHLINYPSLKGAGTVIFKFSHAIGDGYSFVKVLISGLKRADNPALPLTFPNLSLRKYEANKGNYLGFFSKCINTISDVTWNLLKSSVLEDRLNAIRSGKADVQWRPFSIYSLTLSLERVKQVKSKLGATVNDVISGIISYVIHLYMTRMGQPSNVSSNMTLLVMVNMRILKGYNNINEMLRETDTQGNQSRLLHVTLPYFTNIEKVSPLDFIIKAREAMERKKNSMYIYLIDTILNTTRWIVGKKGYAQLVYLSFKNASTMITSVIGPTEKMALVGNPVGSFYFLVTGIPQSLTFTSVSCMGELKLVATMEKGFIDSQIFSSCMDEAVANIFEAAFGKDTKKSISRSLLHVSLYDHLPLFRQLQAGAFRIFCYMIIYRSFSSCLVYPENEDGKQKKKLD